MNESQKKYILFNIALKEIKKTLPEGNYQRVYRDRYKSGTMSVNLAYGFQHISQDYLNLLRSLCDGYTGRFAFYGLPIGWNSSPDKNDISDLQEQIKILKVELKLDKVA